MRPNKQPSSSPSTPRNRTHHCVNNTLPWTPENRTTSAETDRFKWLLRQYTDGEERSEEELALAVALYTSAKDEKCLVDQLVAEEHQQAYVMRLIVDGGSFKTLVPSVMPLLANE
ncbi:hypothetical protein DL765_005927 [Monosporascus sp. GIB2]|nr:hypothetical protein DL765_005927 [Monosporascus sp. GIB2]